jgi:catechol 2,3-dioxygenase-like lactoylglutathione lyase family enzyme
VQDFKTGASHRIFNHEGMIKIHVASLLVDDQEKALKFYTEKLGFVKKTEVPLGEYKWLTVVSPDEFNGVELVLEPMAFEPAKVYQKALKDAGIPLTAFMVDDVVKAFERLTSLGVVFSMEPKAAGPVMIAVLDDTCGNNIQLVQML